jgi:hypothetical protein
MNKKQKIQSQLLILVGGAAIAIISYFNNQSQHSPLFIYGKTAKQLQAEGISLNPDGTIHSVSVSVYGTDEAKQAMTNLNQRGIPITDESFAAEFARGKSNAQPAVPLALNTTEVVEREGGFAYTLPPDWVLREMTGVSYKMVFGRESDGNPANISFMVVSFDGDLGKFEAASIAQFRSSFPSMGFTNFKVINMSAFETALQQIGVQVVIQVQRQDEKIVRQFLYMFERKDGKKICVTCTTDEKNTYLDDFDAIMKTFRVTR